MNNSLKIPQFFLSANTTNGFFSLYDNLYFPKDGWFCYILKGGPGTGKSTIMKKIAQKAAKNNISAEIIKCSSDPESLDAVILPKLKTAVVDGTAPHVIEPAFPGVSDLIINLGECWDEKKLKKSKNEILNLCIQNSKLHLKSKSYLKAYGIIDQERKSIISQNINFLYLDKNIEKLIKNIFSKKTKNNTQERKENFRFLSSVTPKGILTFDESVLLKTSSIFIIEDNHNIIGNYILQKIRKKALEFNYNILVCPSPFNPRKEIEALIIPSLNTSFIIKGNNEYTNFINNFKNLKLKNSEYTFKKIPTKKYLDTSILNQHKNALKFNNKICKEFLKESISCLNQAYQIHNNIEKYYISAMNYKKINKIADKLISAILSD